jgi:hypothetical protein
MLSYPLFTIDAARTQQQKESTFIGLLCRLFVVKKSLWKKSFFQVNWTQNCDETHNLGAENGFQILQLQSKAKKKRAKGKKGVFMYTMSVNAPALAHMKGDLQLQLPHSPHMHAKNWSLCVPLPTPWHHNPRTLP